MAKYKPIVIALAMAATHGPAYAETAAESVMRQLSEYGYSDISSRRTLLGRIRISASKDGREREIVLNRRTGTILIDRLVSDGDSPILLDEGSGDDTSALLGDPQDDGDNSGLDDQDDEADDDSDDEDGSDETDDSSDSNESDEQDTD